MIRSAENEGQAERGAQGILCVLLRTLFPRTTRRVWEEPCGWGRENGGKKETKVKGKCAGGAGVLRSKAACFPLWFLKQLY
jgi:hypothetical protein